MIHVIYICDVLSYIVDVDFITEETKTVVIMSDYPKPRQWLSCPIILNPKARVSDGSN
jgi:hypothetical protein